MKTPAPKAIGAGVFAAVGADAHIRPQTTVPLQERGFFPKRTVREAGPYKGIRRG